MRLLVTYLAILLLLGSACQGETRKNTTTPEPQTVEEYTRAIIREVQQVILSTDRQLQGLTPQQLEWPTGAGREYLLLQLWTEAGNPVKLLASAPENGEPSRNRRAFYFAGGELFFATRPGAQFIFIDKQLKYRLDGNWRPASAPEEKQREDEQALLEQARVYLEAFDKQ